MTSATPIPPLPVGIGRPAAAGAPAEAGEAPARGWALAAAVDDPALHPAHALQLHGPMLPQRRGQGVAAPGRRTSPTLGRCRRGRSRHPTARSTWRGTLFPLRRGYQDPTTAISGAEALRALRTPDGPATLHLRAVGATIEAEAWGPGADRALADAPDLVGANDDWTGFEPHHDVVRRLRHEHPGLRLTRTGAVTATLIPAICEQKVTGVDARRAYRLLTLETAESAPGPGQLLLPPDPSRAGRAAVVRLPPVRAGAAPGRRGPRGLLGARVSPRCARPRSARPREGRRSCGSPASGRGRSPRSLVSRSATPTP